jgi:hypothetical protein
VIAKCDGTADANAPYWILLDGGWQVDYDGRAYRSGHADPGKWFSAADANGKSCTLVTNAHSYVMRIERADIQTMLSQGFQFLPHMTSGASYYRFIFNGAGNSGH